MTSSSVTPTSCRPSRTSRSTAQPRTVGDTEAGDNIRNEIESLEELVAAFEANIIRPTL